MSEKLQVQNLHKSFGELQVLRDLNFEVADHEFVAIVGPSGCGKTTLLRTIAGIETPDEGKVIIDGRQIKKPGADRGFVFQQDSLLPWRTIWKNLVFGLEVNGRLTEATAAEAKKLLKLVGLSGFENFYPNQISGGMRQRVNLARALALNPEVLIMDEPFSALDAQTREVMQLELLRIWQQGRKTVLFITHQIDEAVFLADRIVVLGRRPGWVKEMITVDLPRPRELAVKRTAAFGAYVDRVWNLIEKDVRASIAEDTQLPAA
ncbi:ABC transporter ATP-binding protein [Microbacteriaceae bacterium K1510]|nr:ABC transporter ATP-binding protein [Microbacteriaceae bacterium K1510]